MKQSTQIANILETIEDLNQLSIRRKEMVDQLWSVEEAGERLRDRLMKDLRTLV